MTQSLRSYFVIWGQWILILFSMTDINTPYIDGLIASPGY